MAENIVQGLFGASPYDIEQQQNAGLFKAADQYAEQSPLQRAAGQMYRAGGMLGGAAAEGMGMVNPRVQEAQQAESILQQIDTSTADGLMKGALLANQMKNPKLAYMLSQAAMKRRMDEADMRQKEAHAKYWEQGGTSGKKTLENIAALSDKEMASKLMVTFNTANVASHNMNFADEETRAAWVDAQVNRARAAYMSANPNAGKSGAPVMPTAVSPAPQSVPLPAQAAPQAVQSPAGFPSVSPEEQARRNAERIAILNEELVKDPTNQALIQELANAKSAASAGKPFDEFKLRNTPVPTMVQSAEAKARAKALGEKAPDIAGPEAYAKEVSKTSGENDVKQEQRVIVAVNSIDKLDKLKAQLEKGDVETGLAADFRKGVNKALAVLGGREGARKASETEIADVLMGSDVFPLIQSLGIGARGMDTPEERRFMRSVLTGDISLEKNTLLEMTRLRKEALQREIDQWNGRVDRGELKDYQALPGKFKGKYGVASQQQPTVKFRKYNPATGKIE